MSAAGRRPKGTGTTCLIKGAWHAYGPEFKRGDQRCKQHLRGGFLTRGEAERFLDAWLLGQQTQRRAA